MTFSGIGYGELPKNGPERGYRDAPGRSSAPETEKRPAGPTLLAFRVD
jgi:hypothetical protein